MRVSFKICNHGSILMFNASTMQDTEDELDYTSVYSHEESLRTCEKRCGIGVI